MNAQLSLAEISAMNAAEHFTNTDVMQQMVPALFAKQAHPKMSGRYSFTNTYDIIMYMHNLGWCVTSIMGGASRYSKVLVRMRNVKYTEGSERDFAPELVALDSHDGSSVLKLLLGIIRFICMNGCVAGDIMYARSYRHVAADLMAQVMLDLGELDEHIVSLQHRIDDMRNHMTTIGERIFLAQEAIKARFPDNHDSEFIINMRASLLAPRRREDDSNDLYTVMNVIQENTIRGGRAYVSNNRMQRMRAIGAVDRSLHINQDLWTSAENVMKNRKLANA